MKLGYEFKDSYAYNLREKKKQPASLDPFYESGSKSRKKRLGLEHSMVSKKEEELKGTVQRDGSGQK
jgi:hypothetical protein